MSGNEYENENVEEELFGEDSEWEDSNEEDELEETYEDCVIEDEDAEEGYEDCEVEEDTEEGYEDCGLDDKADEDEIEHIEEIEEGSEEDEGSESEGDEIDDAESALESAIREVGDELEEEANKSDEDEAIVNNDSILDDKGNLSLMDTNGDAFDFNNHLPINKIYVPKRIRTDMHTGSLEKSIQTTGLAMPIVVAPTATKGEYVLISGYRRLVALAKIGRKTVPAIINMKVKTNDISVLEALYNHYTEYSMKEKVDYINYLENEKHILDQSIIEFLLQLENGDYPRIKDILNDDDAEIVENMLSGKWSVDQAYNKLKKKRKEQSKEEKEMDKAEKVYGGEMDKGLEALVDKGESGNGEEGEDVKLTEEDLKALGISAESIIDNIGDKTIEELQAEGDAIDGYEPEQQKVGERHPLDPELRKAVIANSNTTCQCCGVQGPSYVSVLDVHHVTPVFMGGKDALENLIPVCLVCHKLIHKHARGELFLPKEYVSEAEKERFKKILAYGNSIRVCMQAKGMKVEQLKAQDNAESIGREKYPTKNSKK